MLTPRTSRFMDSGDWHTLLQDSLLTPPPITHDEQNICAFRSFTDDDNANPSFGMASLILPHTQPLRSRIRDDAVLDDE
jgi:hypothetical protein